ncbi:hypothetical protein ACI2JB_01390 [Pantoea agglomerans]|uniref:hypothetical protein n=1 Tax=Enterobacter agglomerans TaxID=549 RepID=UPI00384D222B
MDVISFMLFVVILLLLVVVVQLRRISGGQLFRQVYENKSRMDEMYHQECMRAAGAIVQEIRDLSEEIKRGRE